MISALIILLIIIAAGMGAFWFIDSGMPEPIRMIAKLVVAVLGLLAILEYVLPSAGLR